MPKGSGRKPKPQELKDLQGTARPDRDNKNAPKFGGKPVMPALVAALPHAKAEWERVMNELAALDLLKATDQAALTGYCVQWSRWLQAEETVTAEGQTVNEPIVSKAGEVVGHRVKRHPATIIASDALKLMKAIASSFGFDPSSRTKINLNPDDETEDPFEKFLNGGDDSEDSSTEEVDAGTIH